MKTINFFLLTLVPILFIFLESCGGTFITINSPLFLHRKAYIEYDYEGTSGSDSSDYKNLNKDALLQSFDSMSLELIIPPEYTQRLPKDSAFYTTELKLWDTCQARMERNRSVSMFTHPIYLYVGWYATVFAFPGGGFLGLANNKLYNVNYDNWTFVFQGNIKYRPFITSFWEYPGVRSSAVNLTTQHELGHQIGNIFGDNAHFLHTPNDPDSCAMRNASSEFTVQIVGDERQSWHFCSLHRDSISNGPDIVEEYQDKYKINPELKNSIASQKLHKQNYEIDSNLKISLTKTIFKKYEPILIQINYKNISNSNDSIYGLFDSYTQEMETIIFDQNNILIPRINTPEISFIYDKPKFILKPNEELILSRSLSYYGNQYKVKDRVFGQLGYLNPGRYKIYIEASVKQEYLRSNLIEFEVTEINAEDMEILESVKKEDFALLKGKYNGNSFIEHVLAYKSIVHFPDSDLLNIYKDFFDRYPYSMYCINDFFVRGLFDKLLHEDPNMKINSEYEKIKNLYEKSFLGDLLKNEFYKQSIIDDLIYKKNRGKK